jgi:hypothetical protein
MLEVKGGGGCLLEENYAYWCWGLRWEGRASSTKEDDFCQKEDSFSFCNQNFFYGIQYQGPRTYSMDNHPSNQFADTSTELPCKNARKNQSDVSSSVDFRDNCPSALHEMPVYCPVKVGWWSSHEVWWTVVRSVGLGMFSSYVALYQELRRGRAMESCTVLFVIDSNDILRGKIFTSFP